mgnify:CR=1 FL=1
MAYTLDRVERALKDFFNLTEEEARNAIIASGVANEKDKLTQKALDEEWGTMEHGEKKITQKGQQHIGVTVRKIMAKLD